MNKIMLSRIIEVVTNSYESSNEMHSLLRCPLRARTSKTSRELETLRRRMNLLSEDRRIVVHRFLQNDYFARQIVCCLGYIASARLDKSSLNNSELIKVYNAKFRKNEMERVVNADNVEIILGLVGLELSLTGLRKEVSVCNPWISLLVTFAVICRRSVWSVHDDFFTTICKGIPDYYWISTFMLCRMLREKDQNRFVLELLRRDRSDENHRRLVELLTYSDDLSDHMALCAVHRLMLVGVTRKEVRMIKSGKYAAIYKNYVNRGV